MMEEAVRTGLPKDKKEPLNYISSSHTNIFWISSLSCPLIKVEPLKFRLVTNAKPFLVHLNNFRQEQNKLRSSLVRLLVDAVMAYFYPVAARAFLALLVSMSGTSKYELTVVWLSRNQFIIKHQFITHMLEQKLTEIGKSNYFTGLDLFHLSCNCR